MLVKNTIIALMAVAPAFAIPVSGPAKSTGTVAATTKSTAPTTAKVSKAAVTKANNNVSKAAVTKANNNVKADVTNDATLRKELKAVDAKLARDKTADKQLKLERTQQKANTKTSKAKLTDSTGKHTTKLSKESRLSTGSTHLGTTKNKNNLRISTAGAHGTTRTRHSVTPGSAITTPGTTRTRHSVTPGSALTTPRSGLSPFRSAVQSPFFGGYSGFQSPGFSSPFPNGMSDETVNFTPSTGGGYTEKISFSPQRQRLSRRAVTPVTTSASLTPISPQTPPHKSRKSTIHMHTLAEAMQLTALLVQAEKVVNGLEGQMNMPQTAFATLRRKSKSKRPTTPTTPATPVTPSHVKTT